MLSVFPCLLLAAGFSHVFAANPGGFEYGGLTLVSAMMMFLGNENSVYILDKAEGNPATINGHSAWGSLWDIKTRSATPMDIRTNSFCASGMHLPNGSFVTFGGNDAVTVGGKAGSQKNPDGTGAWDLVYQDFDGRRSIRILNPCKISDNLNSGHCAWFDQPDQLSMKKQRWYSTAEPNGEGRIILIGGMVTGGYINRVLPNTDPAREGGSAEPTYEYFPAIDGDPQVLDFVVKTSGLNAYPHAFLMPSGRMLLQANISTTLWNFTSNTEYPLPDMPNGIVRVYPASGATAMLPLTPANNWTPTLLFCGGNKLPDDNAWGTYGGPNADTWNIVASQDCQRLTPEPLDGSVPAYEQDDDMLEPRTLSQFIILPTGQMLLINGALNGTGGYSNVPTPYDVSLAAGPVLTPAIYDPKAPKGSRWSRKGLSPSQIPRLYHSTAILLPDASVLVAGSNPNPDANTSTVYPTEYRSDIFFPPYFSAGVRPSPLNLPQTLSYGGPGFDIVLLPNTYTGNPNDVADATIVTLVRGGFTTHAMNMGQRFIQLNNTYTVYNNGTILLHVSQLPPNPNLMQPGPALLYVVTNGVPSIGKQVIVGNGNIGPQPILAASELPASVKRTGNGTSTTPNGSGSQGDNTSLPKKHLVAGLVGGLAVAFVLCLVVGFIFFRSRSSEKVKERMALLNPLGLKSSNSDNGSPEPGVLAPLAPEAMSEVDTENGSGLPYPRRPLSGVERSTSQLYSSVDFDPYNDLLGSPKEMDSMTNLNPPVLNSGYTSQIDSSQVSSNQPSCPNLPGTVDLNESNEPSSQQ